MITMYHITDPKNAESIRDEGLIASYYDGHAWSFAFTRLVVADEIATNQIFLPRYALFGIVSDGIEVEPLPDDCGEMAAPFQRIIPQARIAPEYLEYMGEHEPRQPTTWSKILDARLNSRMPLEEFREVFEELAWGETDRFLGVLA